MSTFRQFVGRGWLGPILAVWAASIPAAEGVFRLLGDRPSIELRGLYTAFGAGSYKLAAGVDTGARFASGAFSVHTDALGLRCDVGRRFAIERGATVNSVFFGDSQGFGNGVNFEETIPGSFAMNAPRGFGVVNASVAGHGDLNQLEMAHWLCDKENVNAKTFIILLTPLMAVYSESYNRAVIGPDGRLYNEVKNPLQLLGIWVKRNAVVYARVRDAIRNCGVGVKPSAEIPLVFRVFGADEPEELVRDRLISFLKQFRELASSRGAALVVVYVPLTVEVEFASVKEAAARRGLLVDLDRPLRVAGSAAGAVGVRFLNLRPILEAAAKEGEPLNLAGDFHYTGKLSRMCGEHLWAILNPPQSDYPSEKGASDGNATYE